MRPTEREESSRAGQRPRISFSKNVRGAWILEDSRAGGAAAHDPHLRRGTFMSEVLSCGALDKGTVANAFMRDLYSAAAILTCYGTRCMGCNPE